MCLGQIGEFSFILCEIARGPLISDDAFQLIVAATVVTMFLTPYLVTSAPDLVRRLVGKGKDLKCTLAEKKLTCDTGEKTMSKMVFIKEG